MQSGLQLLHAKRAGRFQRGVADERDDPVVDANTKRDRLYRHYGGRTDAAARYRRAGGGGALRVQIPFPPNHYQWHAAGSKAADSASGDGTSSEPGCAGGRSDKSTLETGGAAEST